MSLTTDPNDPRLCRGSIPEKEKTSQCEVYLVLPEEERKKDFVRPLRQKYIHIGKKIEGKIRPLTEQEKKDYGEDYAAFDEYPETKAPLTGRYLTQEELNKIKNGYIGGCGTVTQMSLALSETYAINPKFYGATYCMNCQKHFPVEEFVWDGTNELVGS
jgi:hypothetical protein